MSADSSTIGPREVLMSLADGFIACSSAAPTRPFVLWVSTRGGHPVVCVHRSGTLGALLESTHRRNALYEPVSAFARNRVVQEVISESTSLQAVLRPEFCLWRPATAPAESSGP